MTGKYSCLEVIRVFEQCRVSGGGGDSRLGAEEVIYSWFAFCTSLQGTMITLSVFQQHTNTRTLSSFSRGQKLTQGIVLNQWRTQEFCSGKGGGGGVSTNSVEDRQREQGCGGGSPLARASGGSCNLVQEISFHIVKFS